MAQVEEAQKVLDTIASLVRKKVISNYEIDNQLTKLYTIIPRRMKNVKDFILNGTGDKKLAKEILNREQDSVDIMRGQVSINSNSTTTDTTLEQVLGVKISKIIDDETINKIKDMMGDDSNKFSNLYEIEKMETKKAFEDQKNKSFKHWSKLLWHGSRNENWLNILKTGLKIRPSCAIQTGAMFGNGAYFADRCKKSLGYTSAKGSYWAKGNDNQSFLALYDVNTGKEFRIQSHVSKFYDFNYNELRKEGEFDSLFAKGGVDLFNNEYIVYKETQCTIKYLVEIRN